MNCAKLLLALGTLLVTVTRLSAHCEVPCGIYGDPRRFEEMLEDQSTIAKANAELATLVGQMQEGPTVLAVNQTCRWVDTKEQHATRIQHTIAQYFMATAHQVRRSRVRQETCGGTCRDRGGHESETGRESRDRGSPQVGYPHLSKSVRGYLTTTDRRPWCPPTTQMHSWRRLARAIWRRSLNCCNRIVHACCGWWNGR